MVEHAVSAMVALAFTNLNFPPRVQLSSDGIQAKQAKGRRLMDEI